jgi:hypothetical protein
MTTVLARRILGGALATAAMATGMLSAPLTANAATAQAETSSVVALATCRYVVNDTGVRARYGPGTTYGIYRVLTIGEVVSGPCELIWNGPEGRYWVKLYTRAGFFVYAAAEFLSPQQ